MVPMDFNVARGHEVFSISRARLVHMMRALRLFVFGVFAIVTATLGLAYGPGQPRRKCRTAALWERYIVDCSDFASIGH